MPYRSTPERQRNARSRAWRTRRQKYGPKGHAGSYARPCSSCERMSALIVRLHNEGVLSEGQAAKALGVDRITLRARSDATGGVHL
jgi:hypothetical protein